MAKLLKDILKGVKSSTKKVNDLGGYAPKAGDEADFVKKHEIEKHADRTGNGDDIFNATNVKHSLANPKEKHHGYKKPEDAKVNEAKETEDAQCNSTAKGTSCPVHGMNECMTAKKIIEDDHYKNDLPNMHKDLKSKKLSTQEMRRKYGMSWKKLMHHTNQEHDTATRDNAIAMAKKHMNEEVELDEVSQDTLGRYRRAAKSERMDPKKGAQRKAGMGLALKKILGTDAIGNKPKVKATNEEAEQVNEETLGDHAGLAKYADKHGRIDKEDLHTAAKHMKSGNMEALKKHLHAMDTDPRDKALEHVHKKHYAKLGYSAEEVEHLDELKKTTLASYVRKASHDVATKSAATGRYADRANKVRDEVKKGDYSNYQQGKKDDATADKMFNKSWKRRKGIDTAVSKLAHTAKVNANEEVEQVDELSKKTLGSYINKAVANKGMNDRYSAGKPKGDKESDKVASQRASGIKMAVKKLAKEEVEQIDEISSSTLVSYSQKAHQQVKGNQPSDPDKLRKRTNREKGIKLAFNKHYQFRTKVPATTNEEVELDEVLTKSTTAGETIHDFVHSKNSKFAGKSKEKRKEMALGAYYAKQRNEETNLEEEDVHHDGKMIGKILKNLNGDYFTKRLKYQDGHKSGPSLRKVHKSKEAAKQHLISMHNANKTSEIVEVNHRDYGAKGKIHPDVAKNMKVGQYADFYSHGTGNKQYGMVTKNTGTAVHIKADKKTHKFSVTPHLGEDYAVEPLLGDMKPRGSSDEAAEMVKSELKALANKAMHLVSQMPDSMHVEPWVQAKIAQAKSYVSDVHDYCIYGDHDKPEEDEQNDTPMTFPGMSVDQGRI